MNSEPILYSDLSQINLKLHTRYADIGSDQYFGEVKVKSIKVHFDSYSASVTGINFADLYIEGVVGDSSAPMDLYVLAADKDSNDLYIYTHGTAFSASGEMPLWTEGMIPATNDTSLYIYGIPFDHSGTMPLFIKANTFEIIPLFIEGLDPPSGSAGVDLYTWGTPFGAGGIYESMSLYIDAQSPWHMPLYLHNVGPSGPVDSGDFSLYLNAASGINNDVTYMYVKGHDVPTNTLNLFTTSISIESSSIPLYTSGSGLPTTNTMTTYTHGY